MNKRRIKRFVMAAALIMTLGLGGNAAVARPGGADLASPAVTAASLNQTGYQTGGYQTVGKIILPAVQVNLPAVQNNLPAVQ